jgi:hypothetical protein
VSWAEPDRHFGRGTENALLYHMARNKGRHDWEYHGGNLATAPSVASRGDPTGSTASRCAPTPGWRTSRGTAPATLSSGVFASLGTVLGIATFGGAAGLPGWNARSRATRCVAGSTLSASPSFVSFSPRARRSSESVSVGRPARCLIATTSERGRRTTSHYTEEQHPPLLRIRSSVLQPVRHRQQHTRGLLGAGVHVDNCISLDAKTRKLIKVSWDAETMSPATERPGRTVPAPCTLDEICVVKPPKYAVIAVLIRDTVSPGPARASSALATAPRAPAAPRRGTGLPLSWCFNPPGVDL